ncbi:MAG: DUF3267 domain-containing protein [Bacillota bacterium]|nr:DUF3267 domain-containing protein [Bacillota bacterium]
MVIETEKRLTKTQQEGKEIFETLRDELSAAGYKEKPVLVSALKANVVALLIAIPMIMILYSFYEFVHEDTGQTSISMTGMLLLAFFVSIVIHELIHGISFALFTKEGWKSIKFGVIWKVVTPYCTCREPLPRNQYLISAMLPTIILGVIPYIFALVIKNKFLLDLSVLNILGGGGDIYISLKLRKYKEHLVIDHPYLVGCVAFQKTNID